MKTYIYNKVKAAGKQMACLLLLTPMLASCLDTIILPDDKTVDENFWKTKEDVASMVNAAYAAMGSEDVITRLLIWGDYRSDEMLRTTSISGTIPDALEEIAAVGMQTTNQFATWSAFYNVINRCNIVLERSEEVMLIDPNYTQSDYEADRCQMLALRSLCYFYLVRNYHDVPYVTVAFMNSSQNTQYGQSAPLEVIDQLIETLEEVVANPNCLRSNSYTTSEWRRVGWMTVDAVNALLADIYLWRASVMHTASDYQKCVEHCDLVIASKQEQHVAGRGDQGAYPLNVNVNSANNAYTSLYVDQNAEESIFELQTKNNAGVCKYFYKYGSNTSTEGFLKAASIFGSAASTFANITNNNVFATNDLRYYASCFSVTDGAESYDVRKMISTNGIINKRAEARSMTADRTFGSLDQNYIIYRLPDVMLMKVEALTQLMDDAAEGATEEEAAAQNATNSARLQEAFTLVQAVNTRSLHSDNIGDSIKWTNYRNYSKQQMEKLVMEERLREFCFEGKRWYDLLRYAYRNMEGVQYGKTLADQAGDENQEATLPAIDSEMLKLLTRSRGTDAAAVQAKMRNEAYLYLPIPESDFNVCPLLRQNPAYKSTNAYQKTY